MPELAVMLTQPPIRRVTYSSQAIERPEPEVGYSAPFNADIRDEWNCTYFPPICFHGVGRDNFIFTIYIYICVCVCVYVVCVCVCVCVCGVCDER